MKISVSEATGIVLDYMVAKAKGLSVFKSGAGPSAKMMYIPKGKRSYYKYEPTVNWKQGGAIIEQEWLDITPWPNETREDMRWHCQQHDTANDCAQYGPTPLIAAMRCYVASKLGDEVDIPEGIL